ncbi:MAG: hypothetical protein AB9907_07950 [Flexilinea sp.]
METWSICAVQYADKSILVKATQKIDLAWLEAQYTENIYFPQNISKKIFKAEWVRDKGGKSGEQYPYWCYRLQGDEESDIAWQIMQYLLFQGWEPYSVFPIVAGEGNLISSAPEYLFRKQVN